MIGLQGPAYILRRPELALRNATTEFHRNLGFAVVRDTDHGQFFTAGDTWGVKTVYSTVGRPAHHTDAELVPIVATDSLTTTLDRSAARGLSPALGRGERTVYFRAPDGGLVGVTDREPDSVGPDDELPDGAGAASEYRGTRFVERRCANPDTVAQWYRDVLELTVFGPNIFDLGEGVSLVVVGGGHDRGQVNSKDDAPDALMLRVHDFSGVCARLLVAGATWLERPFTFPTDTSVTYLQDPEGVVISIAQRAPYPGNSEDIVAHQRWLARTAAAT